MLLDDVLAALDVHTAKWVVDKCLKGNLLRGRTIILVTHNLALVGKRAAHIVAVSSNGLASVRETTDNALAHDPQFKADVTEQEDETTNQLDDAIDPKDPEDENAKLENGKLVADEEVVLGSVSYSASEFNQCDCTFCLFDRVLRSGHVLQEYGRLGFLGNISTCSGNN